MIEIRQRKPYNWELAWPTNTVVVRQKVFFFKIILTVLVKVLPHKKKHEKSTLSTPVKVTFS